jgi:hypothetical protein
MIKNSLSRLMIIAGTIGLLVSASGCSGLFRDPLEDKETGDKITVLLMDRNFIKTKLVLRLQDMNGSTIDSEEVEIRFIGTDASNLITFSGYKQSNFLTRTGLIEIGADPNIPVNDQNPLEFTIIANSQNYISVPQFVSYTGEGVKNLTIRLNRKSLGKSLSGGAFSEPFDISFKGVLNSTQLEFMGDISGSPTGTAYEYINMYSTADNGNLVCSNLKDNVLYSDYGVYYFGPVSGSSLLPPAAPSRNASLFAGDFVYSSVLRSGVMKCQTGLTIHVEQAGDETGTGVFDYLITFSDGTTQSGQITCTFPSDNLIEPIYYPGADASVSVLLSGDAQFDMSAAINLATACGSRAEFVATPKSSLKSYKFITQYSCPDTPVGMGLTIMGEFRKEGSSGEWTFFEFIEGVCELQLEPDASYEFRFNIDGEYHSYSMPTDPAKVESYLTERQNEDYRLRSLTVTSAESLVTIRADVEFSQGVCDKLQ